MEDKENKIVKRMEAERKMLGVRKYNNIFSADQEEPGITLVLKNGEDLKTAIKKAQHLSAELQNVLEYIKHFDPKYQMK
ncbi:hypothetical protein [Lactiplantibacillus mudanjiangensis]|uniref:Uncharacterized protein n=1 Tax=Lactiplantibacillus mudanjiangensis TaxID=1296538 RepID=A0A660E8J2_9LACO|nr:hypothetical protein [Lactiplantibacillus mudanjiangensis]VDG25852.1 hypothetical protein [Lactobacillus plantarum subsp. plantarum] [Lactiplantibacillus mudanjiangensis]VDG28719.1 hypothetical protein [Lactobacillus plantarum subsp. plantarum] [Lactiplantibacillus mudanjiangensis]